MDPGGISSWTSRKDYDNVKLRVEICNSERYYNIVYLLELLYLFVLVHNMQSFIELIDYQ